MTEYAAMGLSHGQGPLDSKIVVVVDGGKMEQFSFLDNAFSCLKQLGIKVEVFEGAGPENDSAGKHGLS